ncbi:MAG: hypothetical protein ACI9VI_002811, partial [Candidatus Azotimanducaceae bacterium]
AATDTFAVITTDGTATATENAVFNITGSTDTNVPLATNDDWSNALNWSLGAVPLASDDVLIPGGITLTADSITLDYLSLDLSGILNVISTTFAGPGDLTLNAGSILSAEGASSIGATTFTQDGQLIINASTANGNANLTVANGFTNNSTISIDATDTAVLASTLTITSGTLTNTGTIAFDNTGGAGIGVGIRRISGGLDNQGTLDVNYSAEISGANAFITDTGIIDVAAGITLTINKAATTFGTGTILTGTGSIDFIGSQALSIDSNFTLDSATQPALSFGGPSSNVTVDGAGLLTLASGTTLLLDNDTILTNFVNLGTTIAKETSAINSASFTQQGSLTVLTDSVGVGTLHVANNFTNEGTLTLDTTVASGITTLNVTGTFLNSPTGIVVSESSNASSGTSQVINTQFQNQGTLTVFDALTINDTGSFFNSGNITIKNNGSLTISGVSQGLNTGNITLEGVSGMTAATTILDVSGMNGGLDNNGTIDGIGTVIGTITNNAPTVGASPGLITITENFIAGNDSNFEVELEGEEAGITYDQLDVLGTANLKGSLQATLLNGYRPSAASNYAVLTAGILLGSFDEAHGLDFSNNEVLDINYNDNSVTLSLVETTNVGTSSDDNISTVNSNSVIVAGDGNDYINTVGSDSIIYAQAGNDVITLTPDFKRVDGGEGIDTLVLAEDVNYTEIQGTQIDRVEILSLDDKDADTIALDSDAIAKLVDGSNELTGIENSLVVIGNTGDIVNLNGDFLFSGESTVDAGRGEESFRTFSDGESTLLISDEISLALTESDGSILVFNSGDSIGNELLSQGTDETISEDYIDLSGVTSLPSLASTTPITPSALNFDLSDLFNNDHQEDLYELLGGVNDLGVDLNGAISALGSSQGNSLVGGEDSLTTYFSDGSSSQFVIYTNLSDGEYLL